MNKLFLLFIFILILSCSKDSEPESESNCYSKTDPPSNSHKVTIDQGVWGDVWFWSGDFRPGNRGEICQVKRKLYLYGYTTIDDVEQIDYTPFYSAIHTNFVLIVESDNKGFFQIELEPGNYSLFVKEDDKFYSNLFDGYGGIFPITIELDKIKEVRFDITYKATF